MIDRILALVSFLSLVFFLAILVYYIREPDLTVVVVIGIVMAAYDFWRELAKSRDR